MHKEVGIYILYASSRIFNAFVFDSSSSTCSVHSEFLSSSSSVLSALHQAVTVPQMLGMKVDISGKFGWSSAHSMCHSGSLWI
jgi:hypothetical protein